MKGKIDMKKVLLFLTIILLAFTGCEDNIIFDYSNTMDPKSDDFNGEIVVSDPDRLIVVAPKDKFAMIFPVLEISSCPNVEGYGFEVATSSGFDADTIVWEGTTPSSSEVTIRPDFDMALDITYYWRAYGLLLEGGKSAYSKKGSFIMSSGITDVFPEFGVEHADTTPLLNWGDLTGEGAVTYQVRYARNENDLETAVIHDVSDSECQVDGSESLQYGETLYWQVRAVNENSVEGAWTRVFYFDLVWNIDWVLDPVDKGSTIDTSPLLFWDSVDEAVSYRLRYAVSEAELETADVHEITDPVDPEINPEFQIDLSVGLSMGDRVYWQLRATNTDGAEGEWSSVFDFEISLNVDWQGVTPADNGMAAETRPLLNWSDVSGAVTYSVRFASAEADVESSDVKSVSDSEYQIGIADAFHYGDMVYWQIQAWNEDGDDTAWSDIYEFEVNWDISWSGFSPADDAVINTTTLTLDWDDVTLAASYRLVYAESEAALSTADTHTVTESEYEITDPFENGTEVFWKVVPLNGNDEPGEASDVYSFTVGISSHITITPDLGDPDDAITITLSGVKDFLMIGDEMTVSASFSSPVDSQQWYFDGVPLAGSTSTSVSIGAGLGLGGYTLTVVANSGDQLFSESHWFKVDDSLELGQSIGGGLVFYIDDTDENNRWALIAAEADQGSSNVWGGYGTWVGTSTALGSGAANTAAIVNAFGASEPYLGYSNYAAKICDDLELNGYDDWYLPSYDDAYYMYLNLSQQGLGSFTTGYYWTSSESNNSHAYYARIYYNSRNATYKTYSYYVRAVRTMEF